MKNNNMVTTGFYMVMGTIFLILFLASSFCLISLGVGVVNHIKNDGYEIEHRLDPQFVTTYVWHEGDIIKSWHDPTDSIAETALNHKKEAIELIKKLRSINGTKNKAQTSDDRN